MSSMNQHAKKIISLRLFKILLLADRQKMHCGSAKIATTGGPTADTLRFRNCIKISSSSGPTAETLRFPEIKYIPNISCNFN